MCTKLEGRNESIIDLTTVCVMNIISSYYENISVLTLVDAETENNEIFRAINAKLMFTIISRTSYFRENSIVNEGYIVLCDITINCLNKISDLTQDRYWNPRAKFILVIYKLDDNFIRKMFLKLMRMHIINISIIGLINENIRIVTYDPFDNFGCGRSFDQITEYNYCPNPSEINLYPDKLKNGFKNCSLTSIMSDLPPFVISDEEHNSTYVRGMEPFIMKMLAEMEGFNNNFVCCEPEENVPNVLENWTATESLGALQRNEADFAVGGHVALLNRAILFDYLFTYNELNDFISLITYPAEPLERWKEVYIEFSPSVWLLILLIFILYYLIVIYFFKRKSTNDIAVDKITIALIMLDCLFSHSAGNIIEKKNMRFLFMVWIFFTFLLNCCYQTYFSSLTSTRNFILNYKNPQLFLRYNMTYCIGNGMLILYMKSLQPYVYDECEDTKSCIKMIAGRENLEECLTMRKSALVVAKNPKKFSLMPLSFFNYYGYGIRGVIGNPLLEALNKPDGRRYWNKHTAIYVYRGFPLLDRFNLQLLRLREVGLTVKNRKDVFYKQEITRRYESDEVYERRAVNMDDLKLPFCILIFGSLMSLLAFFIEIFI